MFDERQWIGREKLRARLARPAAWNFSPLLAKNREWVFPTRWKSGIKFRQPLPTLHAPGNHNSVSLRGIHRRGY